MNWTGTNNQLMLKHCNKSDKITKINYQQPHYVLYYCHLCENNEYYGTKREALLVRTESQFCHQSYQNSIEKHECTFMLHKKRDNYYKKKKKIVKTYPKESISRSQSFNSHLFMVWLRGNITTNSTLPIYRIQTASKNFFILTLSQPEVVKTLAYWRERTLWVAL